MTSALLLSALLVFSTICTDDDWKAGAFVDHVDGDVVVCYLSKITSQKSIQNLLSFQAVVTNQTYWPKDVTVGYVVVKWFNKPDESHVNRLLEVLHEYPKIIAFVGFVADYRDVIQSASFVSSIRIPTFTCSNGLKIDQLLEVDGHEFMTRITGSRTQQISGTIPSILDGLGTNIVSVFYTQEKSLEFSKLTQQLDLRKDRVDLEYHEQLTGDLAADGKAVVNHLFGDSDEDHSHIEEQRMHTVIFLLPGKYLAELIIYLASQKVLSGIVFITDSGGCMSTREFQTALENLTAKKVYFFRLCQTAVYKVPELINYIDGYNLYSRSNGELKPASKVIANWYKNDENLTPCVVREDENCISLGQACTGKTTLSRYNHRFYYTTRKILQSLENITKEQVEDISKRTFQDLLINSSSVGDIIYKGFHENNVDLPENTTFLRYSNGSMVDDYEVLFDANGHYGKKSAIWTSGENNSTFEEFMSETKSDIISATPDTYLECSRDCFKGSKQVPDRNFLNCWTCVPCIGNTYTENGSWPSCKKCDSKTKFLWVNEENTACDQKAGSVNFNTTSGIIIWIIASLNIAVLIFTIIIYIKYWTSRVIVSSGRELCCVMFSGILVGHIESLLIAVEPTGNICILIQVLAHFFMMLTVCPLLVKTFRIWMVFKFSVKMGRKIRNYVNDWVTMAECLILMVPQLVFLLFGLFMDDSFNFKFTINYVEESLEHPINVTKSCGPLSFTMMLISIVYTGILLLVSSILGWDCRKLPDNFKESMYIFLSSLISLLLVVVYVPAMLTMAGFTQVSLLAGVISIISVTLNLVIFMPKIFVVLFVPPLKQKEMFKITQKSTGSTHSQGAGESRNQNNGEVGV